MNSQGALPSFNQLSDEELQKLLQNYQISLTVEEARLIEQKLQRTPTLAEAVLFGIQGSEHCSYKSSRKHLKLLPTSAPNVILGPGEDAGIVEIATYNGERFGLIVGHESHNHPSQVVPFEGAATGVGGCVRDVVCMGGRVIGVLDALRFGELEVNTSRQIAEGVVSGIGGYGNPLGVANLGGDAYFDKGFNENCLVNVVAVGIVKESEIIHSYVPPRAAEEQWDIIVVGKPTDRSGMGGASFSSGALDVSEKEKNKGAVQEPNPFLERHILVSTYDLFHILKEKHQLHNVSFKDMGAGGVTCSTVEQVAKTGLGARIDLEEVNVALQNLPPEVIGCAETQERFAWMCHPSVTPLILEHYNKTWDLPGITDNAGAVNVGKVAEGNYVLEYKGEVVVDAPASLITQGFLYDRPMQEPERNFAEPVIAEPQDYNKIFLDLLSSENIACRKPIYEKYDKQVQGYTVIEAGEADASVIVPLLDENVPLEYKRIGMAFSTDSNPRYGEIDPYYGALNSVVEAMRNVAAVGAYPQAITNCLNYGNPEKPEQMWELAEGVRGIADACRGIELKNYPGSPTPVISGNVSLYNEHRQGHVPPSAIICCIGKIDNVDKAVTMQLKRTDSVLFLLGERKNELGGSEYYRLLGELGANVPREDLAEAQKQIYTVVDAVAAGYVLSAHDISEGGLAIALAEMAIGGRGEGEIGFEVDIEPLAHDSDNGLNGLRTDTLLFSQTGGFVVEVASEHVDAFSRLCEKYGVVPYQIGMTSVNPHVVYKKGATTIISVPLDKAAHTWMNGLREKW